MQKANRKHLPWRAPAALLVLAALLLTACSSGTITSPDGPTQTVGTYIGPGAPEAGQDADAPDADAEDAPAPDGAQAGRPGGTSVTFTDALGRTVTIDRPRRVAVLIGSFADVWCAAGGKDVLVATADDAWTQFGLDLPDTVENIGGAKSPSAEALLAAQPDFVIASTGTQADVDLLPILQAADIPTAYFDVSTFDDYLAMLDICTQITGCPERYEAYGTAVQAQVEAALARAQGREGPSVLYLRASTGSCKVKNSEGSVLGEMLAALGCVNIADSDDSLLEELSMEAILAADPDKIFIVLQSNDVEAARASLEASLLADPAWQRLRAVQSGACHYLDQRLYNLKPNARWGEAYEALAEILYGDSAGVAGSAGVTGSADSANGELTDAP
ncbi:MAG: ABC transporter substrate-binding protein [Subdoligranulum sp.]|nr:ABC transporter substrate-binding protein [Subdoligranulum sp.]